MRCSIFSLFVSLLLLGSLKTVALAQAAGARGADISGGWILTEQFPGETRVYRMSLQVIGDKITGQSGAAKIEGTIAIR